MWLSILYQNQDFWIDTIEVFLKVGIIKIFLILALDKYCNYWVWVRNKFYKNPTQIHYFYENNK